jgi:hypothetical protein
MASGMPESPLPDLLFVLEPRFSFGLFLRAVLLLEEDRFTSHDRPICRVAIAIIG